MAYLLRQGGKVDYNYKEYFLDTLDDLDSIDLNVENPCPGSLAFVISTSTLYILNSKKEWVEQK